MLNWQERLQVARGLFATKEAEAHIVNQGLVDIIAKINKVGTATHDKWYGDHNDTTPTLTSAMTTLHPTRQATKRPSAA